MRPSDLAREHGLSAQAVRNYERDGFLPPAARTASGYRVYTEVHAAALRAFLALAAAHGHATAGEVMRALHENRVGDLLLTIDQSHERLLRDRSTLDAVQAAIGQWTGSPTVEGRADDRTIREVARRLGVTPATLRNWEEAGILVPERDRRTGYRRYGPADVRDAELAHLLRRGGYLLDHIATVVEQVRTAGSTESLAAALSDWRQRLVARGLAMLDAAAALSAYRRVRSPEPSPRAD